MPLKETLQMLREREQADKKLLEDRPKIIDEWKQAVATLFAEIRGYLSEYEKDGSLSFSEETIRLTEDSLGGYGAPVMKIKAGPAVILVEPVGRLIIGALGRVDMHRQGRAGEQQRVMLLRLPKSKTDTTLNWEVRMPSQGPITLGRPPQRRTVPLTKDTLEQAVDFLLN